MKAQILKENLAKALASASKFCSQRAQLPILSHILITAEREGVYLAATDLEIGVKHRIGGKVIEPGAVALPAKMASEFVNLLPLGVVEIEEGAKGGVKIKGGEMEATIQGMSPEEFPKLEINEAAVKLGVVSANDWAEMWKRMEYAVSRDLARPVLTGVRWEVELGRVIATDGYRLSVAEGNKFKFKTEAAQLLVSGAFWGAAAKAMEEAQTAKIEAAVNVETKQLYLKGDDLLVVGRLLEGEFPAYKSILPKGEGVWGIFEKEALLQAVRAAMVFARDGAQIVKFNFTKEGLEIGGATEQGDSKAKLGGEVEGKPMTTAFNGKYVIDFLSHTDGKEIRVGLDDPLKPGKFTEVGWEGFEHVIMPIRLREMEGQA